MSTTERRLRPMRRWISMVRPLCRPRTASRGVRVGVAPGSMLYSAVSQPRPEPRSHAGTPSLTDAVQSTCVSPSSMRAEPAANLATPGVMRNGLSSSAPRPVLTWSSSPRRRRAARPAGCVPASRDARRGGAAPSCSSAPPVNSTTASPRLTNATAYQNGTSVSSASSSATPSPFTTTGTRSAGQRGPTRHMTSVATSVSAAPKGTSSTAIGLATLPIAVPSVSPTTAAGSKQANTVSTSLTRNCTGP